MIETETLEQRLEAAGLLDEVLVHIIGTVERSATAAYTIGRSSGYTDGYRDGAETGFEAGDERGFIDGVAAAAEFIHGDD